MLVALIGLVLSYEYVPCDRSNHGGSRSLSTIHYIVIHFTANNGDTARGNGKYFQRPNLKASAHYFVDENTVIQSVKDDHVAYHAGTSGQYHHTHARNKNSIGIEMCSEKDTRGRYYFNEATVANTVRLVKELMKKYNVPLTHIVRHYDITHKNCPAPFVENPSQWDAFKARL